ncbi:signal recognition particle-docking protein FtsY [Pelobacter propionicus]|uniref:Signal recognition particle receptor FtsY n=1 Tax=Pelobacter propionicus (strain DSM 2379 / NBRC 103807 / OttBd1) TaxID=338966 RepID=A1AU89_PELPD|nr:signal recognition particle-docking protein FtsY [Pelobacter propionicus DSM 2379]
MEQTKKKGFFRGLIDKLSGTAPPSAAETAEPAQERELESCRETVPHQEPQPCPEPAAPAALPVPPPPQPAPAEPPPKPGFFERLKQGLQKTKEGLVGRIDALVLGKKEIDADTLEELEEILITSDVGVKTTVELIRTLEQRLGRNELKDGQALKNALKEEILLRLNAHHGQLDIGSRRPFVLLVIGVNGVGKTTTIGKLASRFTGSGKTVLLAAADTFRAAAAEQLVVWGERSGVEVIRHKEGADPSAVVFDACKAAVARDVDILIVDTAGRMHTKVNLMEEMKKIRRVIDREIPGAPHETLLVVDAATGQNAVSQARLFKEAAGVTGIALTKLDGTAKGGVVVAVSHEFALPVRYIGVGEAIDDLRDFSPQEFTDALFQA